MFNIFKRKKKEKKFTELFVRVRHEHFGEGFIVAYTDLGSRNIGVRFDKSSGDLGSICGDGIERGYKTTGSSDWFYDFQLEEVKDFNYNKAISILNDKYYDETINYNYNI